MKILTIIMMIAALLLVACTAQPAVKDNTTQAADTSKVIETKDTTVVNSPAKPISWDIEIIDGQFNPSTISMTAGVANTITIYNSQSDTKRVEIPQMNVREDIVAGGYAIITATPKYKGIYPLELAGVQLGTVNVK
jgi:heme/copper-type cytochrome/quinol oxidase subunit 2